MKEVAETRFGLYLNQFCRDGRPVLEEMVEQARLAEQAGFDWVVLGDRRAWRPGVHDAITTLAYLAAKTERIGLATAGLILPLYPPILLAEALANIDILSGGRLTAGLVLGYRPEEFAALEVDGGHRVGLYEEGLEILKRVWTSGAVTFDGRHHHLREVEVAPRPLQRPRPHLWGAGRVESAIRRTARLCDGWTSSFNEEPAELPAKIATYLEAPAGPDTLGRAVVICRDGFCAATHEEVRRAYEGPALSLFEAYAEWKRNSPDLDRYRGLTWESMSSRLIAGTPDEFVEQVAAYRAIGADAIVLRIQPPELDHAAAMRCLETLGDSVLPRIER